MRFTQKLFPMILAVLLAAPALLAQNAAQVTNMEIAAAGGCPNLPTVQNSFATTDTAAYVVFTYTGGNAGDNFAVEFIEPNQTVYKTSNFTQAATGGNHCYSYFIDIAGYLPASTPGTWTVVVLWNGAELAGVQFTIGAANPPQQVNLVTAAAGGCSTPPTVQNSFAATASAAYAVFTYTGGNEGDNFAVEFIEPRRGGLQNFQLHAGSHWRKQLL